MKFMLHTVKILTWNISGNSSLGDRHVIELIVILVHLQKSCLGLPILSPMSESVGDAPFLTGANRVVTSRVTRFHYVARRRIVDAGVSLFPVLFLNSE
jgi:hypothetical protein